ncbi:hypothetical protein HDV03_003776 [Kappamyces sp. JEL0829]|nr:hypothetical protein HDV03_003776 [Kappamyces sp. JEL0829]
MSTVLKESDTKVLVTGSDIDGIPRGKIMNALKFSQVHSDGFGFCNVIFAWDLHDQTYEPKTPAMLNDPGFSDIVARVDPRSGRRCPLTNIPHFLVEFYNPVTNEPLPYCPRALLRRILALPAAGPYTCFTGVEFEFFNFKETGDSLALKKGVGLTPLTTGMFGYSVSRTAVHQAYFDDIYDLSRQYGIPLEIIHTETGRRHLLTQGPGVYEAAIEYANTLELCDRAHLFKKLVKQIGTKRKHRFAQQLLTVGHLHFSLKDAAGNNAFSDPKDPQFVSEVLRQFVAGILKGLPSIMALLAPTVNSYKRLNEAYWAPVTVSYGFESRTSAIRIITPPVCSASSTRIEVRVPGADVNCYLACAAITACGYHGIATKMKLPPLVPSSQCERLPATLQESVKAMTAPDSLARTVLGDTFVEHYAATRIHELRLWNLAVTDWELKRYMETV